MTSLYKRATPPQQRILRIVEGAIKNAAHAHSEIVVSAKHRRSIAKRAAGTLSSQWPEVLAAQRTSSDSRPVRKYVAAGDTPQLSKARQRRRARKRATRSPLGLLEALIARPLSAMKARGEHERVEAYIEVLKLIAQVRAKSGEAA